MRVWPGNSYPLGATWDGEGVNFALFSERATQVELCLFYSVEAEKGRQRPTLAAKAQLHHRPAALPRRAHAPRRR
jgi:pullulanase/glycogen debranching enzyme